MAKKDGGPAFGHGAENGHCCGMTIRDWFAGQALVALPMEGVLFDVYHEHLSSAKSNAHERALASFIIADAMIAERDK